MGTTWFVILVVLVMVFVFVIISRSKSAGGGNGGSQVPRACPQCGEANPGEAAFCRKCGRTLP